MNEAENIPEEFEVETGLKDEGKKWDRLHIRESDREDYKRLLQVGSPFEGKDNKDPFMMALMLGYLNRNRVKLEKMFGYFRYSYLSSEEKVILNAIAVAEEGDLMILSDKGKILTIAEEYAAGGIKLLKNDVFSSEYGSYIKKLELAIREEFEEYKRHSGSAPKLL